MKFNFKTYNKKHYHVLLVITIILIWGLSYPIVKIGLDYISPVYFAALRLIIATLSMFLLVGLTGNFIWPAKKDLPIIFSIGLLQMGAFIVLITVGLQLVEAGRSSILVYTTPIWVTPIAVFIFKEKAGFFKWLGLLFGMSGVLVLFGPWGFDWENKEVLFGNMYLLIAAVCWAISMLCARYMQWHHSPLELLPWQLLIGTIPAVLLIFFEIPQISTEWNRQLIFSLFFAGVGASGIATWSVIVISKELPAMTTSLSLLLVPVCGIIASSIVLQEPITLINILAMSLIITGLAFIIVDNIRSSSS